MIMLKITTPPNKSACVVGVSMTDEQLNILNDIELLENSKMMINEKKYYVNLIDLLIKIDYYKNRQTLKELWRKK